MSHVDPGPLALYNSLQDKHLIGYFNNTRMRRHLRRSGLITRSGEIVTENTFRLNMARREHQKHVRDLMAQAIVHKALDMERHRQTEIKRKLEEIAKVELVQRVRSSKGRAGDEDITPYLSPRAPAGRPKSAKQDRPRSVVSGHRPSTAPSKQTGASKKKSAIYVDKEGFPVHREQAWGGSDDGIDEVDSHNLRELDHDVLNNITLNMSPEEKQNNSPYKVYLTLHEPRPPPPRSSKSAKSPRGTSRSVITRDGRRVRPKSNTGSLSLHRKEPAYPHPNQQQTLCDVTVRYRGNNLKLQYERQDERDEIIINQQHCGGENLVVFHGLVEPGTDLVFTSRRHRGYPFSLTFFVNSIQVLRLSACCEYKYGPGVMLGGRKGHFKFGRVDGGSPCYRCMVEAELARRERQRYKDTQTDEPKPEPEAEPVLESQGTQSDAPPPESRDQAEAAGAEAYDEDDFEDEDEKQVSDSEGGETPKAEDNRSDNFFSDPEADAEQQQPQEADYGADSDFEADSNHEKQDEKESDKEIQEKEENISVDGEGKGDDAPADIPEEEPVKEEADTEKAEEVPEEQDEPTIPESSHQTDLSSRRDERPSSRSDDSDSSSDSEGHNRVLSSSSSSSSSDDDDRQETVNVQNVDASSSEFFSEDEQDAEKKHEAKEDDDLDDQKHDQHHEESEEDEMNQETKTEEPLKDDKIISDAERRDDNEENAKKQLYPKTSQEGVPETAEDKQQEGNDSDKDITPKEVDTEKPSSKSEEHDGQKKSAVGEVIDNKDDDKLSKEDEGQEDKSFFEKLADNVKDAFTSSDSSSSESGSDDSKGSKKEKRKRKTKSRSSSDEEKNKKTESDSDSDSEKKKSFFEKLKDKFTSSDSDSDSDKEKDATKSESRDDADEGKMEEDTEPEETKELQPVKEEDIKSLREDQEEKQIQDNEDKNEPETSPKEKEEEKEEEEERGWVENEDGDKGQTEELQTPEEVKKDEITKEEENPSTSDPQQEEKDETSPVDEAEVKTNDMFGPQDKKEPEEEKQEENGWIEKREKGIKGVFGSDSSDSENDDKGQTEEAHQTSTEVKEDGIAGQEDNPSTSEPQQDEKDETSPVDEAEVQNNDMFRPQDKKEPEDVKEENGWIEKMEKGIKGVFGSDSSDSENDDKGQTEDAHQTSTEVKEDGIAGQEEKPSTSEPQQVEKDETSPTDMFGPQDSDSEDDKKSDRTDEVQAEVVAETGALLETQEEKSGPSEDPEMQSEKESGKEKGDSASMDKDSEQGDKDEGVSEKAEYEEEKTPESQRMLIDEKEDDSATVGNELIQEDHGKDASQSKDDEKEDKKDDAQKPQDSPEETGASQQAETGDREDDKLKEDKQDAGSLSSRSSASDSGSIAAGLDKDFRVLNLNAKNLDESKLARLVKALKHRKYRNLEYLLLRDNPLTDSGIATIIRSLIEKHATADSALKLTHFDLGNTGVGDEAAAELAKLLALDTPLRNLNISENTLSAAAWETVNQGLMVNKSLVTFSAEYAHLSDTSCVMLTEAVIDHERLEELNVEGNGLGERAGKALAQLVKDNSVLITINLEKDNSIPANIMTEVREILETGSYVP